MGKLGKICLFSVVLILLVGAVVGIFFGMKLHNKIKEKENESSSSSSSSSTLSPPPSISKDLSTTSKSVEMLCAPTKYKDQCVNSLKAAAKNGSASPMDLIRGSLLYTIDEVKKIQKSAPLLLKKNAKIAKDQNAADECAELLENAVEELQNSAAMLAGGKVGLQNGLDAELNNLLTAVLVFQDMCVDGFNSTELKKTIKDQLAISNQLSDNALSMVYNLGEILKAFKIPVNITDTLEKVSTTSKRLLHEDVSEDGFPSWLSNSDRRLLKGKGGHRKPNAVVAKDGSGQFKTISAALAAYPKNLAPGRRYVIYVKAGVYDEYITVQKNQVNVYMYGDGPGRTIVTGNKNGAAGVGTWKTASFSTQGNGFIAKNMGFRNTAGWTGHQAVALRISADKCAFYNCRMDGYQDTLYYQNYRSFFKNCLISGTIDFIFGQGTALIQDCDIMVRKPGPSQLNTVTADGRVAKTSRSGLVLQNCRIFPESALAPEKFKVASYLGRPWRPDSRTIVMESEIGDLIKPEGWSEWKGSDAHQTCFYAEWGNRGAGANTNKRVNWRGYHRFNNKNQLAQFTAGQFLDYGGPWVQRTGRPNYLGFAH